MNREIKFRGKRIANGEWLTGDLLHINEQVLIHPIFNDPNEYPEDFDENVHPQTVGQFTGLYDNDDEKIYEGDIGKGKFATYLITWDKNKAQYNAKILKTKEPLIKNSTFPLWQYVEEDGKCIFEVIGNIHDNPELLP